MKKVKKDKRGEEKRRKVVVSVKGDWLWEDNVNTRIYKMSED